jgi:dTDP-4-dehydrorhamnose reductase
MIDILITGAKGQLGSELQKLSGRLPEGKFTYTDVDTLDITDMGSLEKFCHSKQFRYIINCAAYTAVDKAETEEALAYRINRDAPKNLVSIATKHDSVLIHVSTDYVYDGTSSLPYKEDQPVKPQSAYGRTKEEGEKEVMKYNKSIIIRTAWLYSPFGNNFVKTMLRLGAQKEQLGVVFDQIGTPTCAEDLAGAILSIVEYTEKHGPKSGIYHFSNEGVCSWYDFAWEIFNFVQSKCKVKPIESKDFPTPAKRPSYSVLNKTKIKQTFNIEIPYWKTSLYKCLNVIIKNNE